MKKRKQVLSSLTLVLSLVLLFWLHVPVAFGDNNDAKGNASGNLFKPDKTINVSSKKVKEWYQAVGTVRPKTETRIEAQVRAQVKAVHVRPGAKVKMGEPLVSLDDRQFRSKLDQAMQALKVAEAGKGQAVQSVIASKAALSQAESNYKRIKKYFESQAATSQDLENAESSYLQAKAGLTRSEEALLAAESGIKQAEEVINETKIALGYTSIRAPGEGEVLKRLVEKGDIALPGKPLVILQTSGFLRLEAYVREGLIGSVLPGSKLQVKIDTLNKTVDSVVEEIVPYADPRTRTFLVKTSIPAMTGLYPGMFGKLLIPVNEIEVVVVPREAIFGVGQLSIVYVKEKDSWIQRYVKTGKNIEKDIEILSGLSGSEIIGWKE